MVPIKPIRSFGKTNTENALTIPTPKAIVSVCLIFLHGLAECYVLAGSTEDSNYRCLEEFLNQDVDLDVQL